jgi:hypothetical protein
MGAGAPPPLMRKNEKNCEPQSVEWEKIGGGILKKEIYNNSYAAITLRFRREKSCEMVYKQA